MATPDSESCRRKESRTPPIGNPKTQENQHPPPAFLQNRILDQLKSQRQINRFRILHRRLDGAMGNQRAITSTSPSTPLTTLKGRSNTLPSFLAIARYSPSESTTRGKAPIDSLITSPPGVITDQAVLASASPPLSLTSFSVMTAARCVMMTSVSLPACTRMSERTTELASP